MIQTFNKIKRLIYIIDKEYIISLLITFLILYILYILNFYGDFSYFEEGIKELLLCLIGGFIGLLGFSLSGIAIITGLFSKKHLDKIEKGDSNHLDKIISSYKYLSSIVTVSIMMMVIIYISLFSPRNLIESQSFYIILFCIIYVIVFSMVYTVGLVEVTIKLYKIKNIYDKVIEFDNDLMNDINEIRIDVLLRIIKDIYKIEIKDLVAEIENSIQNSEYKKKDKLIKYIRVHYDMDNQE